MITIIGNGESRASINIDKIDGMKVGCNAIYLYHNVDLICAMDKFWRDKITKECTTPLISRYHNTQFQITLELYDKVWKQTPVKYRSYCSGATALDYICHNYKDKIYLIGFDFDYTGNKVNHIYKNQKFHPNENRPAQNENIFLKQILDTLKRYPLHEIYWVTNSTFDIKINKISISEYKQIAYKEEL